MPTKDFLFELGVEEIPAGYISEAVSKLQSFFKSELKEKKLPYIRIQTFSTPRRIAVKITGLPMKQDDEILEKIGPARNLAFDETGNPTKTALGFLRGASAEVEDIYFIDSPKGKRIAVKKKISGSETGEILEQICWEVISRINFPKSMRWGDSEQYFARPLRWLLALWGNQVLPITINGIRSADISYGNRFQKLSNPVKIDSIEEYENRLRSVFVIADRSLRQKMIQQQLDELFADTDEQVVPDQNLLEIVTDLVEYPTAVIAHFAEKYLQLPQKVITSTLSQHQKYFAVQDNRGIIQNKFVFISNGDPQQSELIKLGNEKVITARLEDAQFYFQEDIKSRLADFVPRLANVTFQENLGSLLDKTTRIIKLSVHISQELNCNPEQAETAKRAAYLCKADLVTQMLGEKEFTKLQGYMGRVYALQSGEDQLVADAVYEHYLPRGERDRLPSSLAGAIIAIADKLDTVCGIIGVDMIPTSSKDPFALRRAANGIVQIIDQFHFAIDLQKTIGNAFRILADKLAKPQNNLDFVLDFFRQRIEWLLKQKGIDFDVIESVMHIEHYILTDLIDRAAALQNFKQQQNFIKLVLGFKRVSNIIEQESALGEPDTSLFKEDSEITLHQEFLKLRSTTDRYLAENRYELILEKFVKFGAVIDKFFDEVLVNVEDPELRQNRCSQLFQIRKLFLRLADISRIVVQNER